MNIIIKTKKFFFKQFLDIKNFGIKELFRKIYLLIKFFVMVIPGIIAIIPCIIIRLLSPVITIRIGVMPAGNFGEFILRPAMYYSKKQLNLSPQNKKYIDFVYISRTNTVFNKQLEKMWKRKLNFLPSYLLEPIYITNRFFPGWKKHVLEALLVGNRDTENFFEKFKILEFTNAEEVKGKKILNNFGLTDKDKFICLAVRDEAYETKKISSRYRNWSYHDYRNWNIDNFILAAEELTKRGYYVFRMGVVVKKALKTKNPKIIDYANSNLRSDFMDVYLGANCTFCVTTGFGFQYLPYIFGKPLVQLSAPVGDLLTHNSNFLTMTKHHIHRKENRKLSLSEIFSYGLAFAYESKIFEEKGIKIIDSTPEEIRDIAIEMDDSLKFKKETNQENLQLQKNFRDVMSSNMKHINSQEKTKNPYHIFHGKIRSRFSSKFLKENKNWLS